MAQAAAAKLTGAPLTPSELVLLYGERFTTAQVLLGRTGDSQITLLHADLNVSARQLGQAILAVALLANERAGAIRLDPRQKKTLLGLQSSDSLFADTIGDPPSWPVSSLESRIYPLAQRLAADKEQNEVVEIVAALLPVSDDPWMAAAGLVIDGLGTRGLLAATEITDEKIFSAKRWELTDSTRRLAADQDIKPVEQLLSDCQRDRAEVWKRLEEQIRQAVERQTDPNAPAS